jgi:hypothetical protein
MCGAGESAARRVVSYLAGQPGGGSFGFEVASPDGATVYFGKRSGNTGHIEKVDIASGTVSTLASDLGGQHIPRVLAVTLS